MSCSSYIKPQQCLCPHLRVLRCMSCSSYIKPQHVKRRVFRYLVVCLVLPTSNHNHWHVISIRHQLYVLFFLHQTTTLVCLSALMVSCMSCSSYIKPQHSRECNCAASVVCLVLPTSNHNFACFIIKLFSVVCLVLPTSNHNHAIDMFSQ